MGIGGGSVLVPWRPAFWIAAEVVLLLFIQGPTLSVRYTGHWCSSYIRKKAALGIFREWFLIDHSGELYYCC